MLRRVFLYSGAVLLALILYLTLWPVPVEPVVWEAPPNSGYTGDFARNERLTGNMEKLPVDELRGPEDVAVAPDGRLYTGTESGWIVRMNADGSNPERWVDTGGWPLGMDFDAKGDLYIADAYLGLIKIAPDKTITPLTREAEGVAITFADDLDIGRDGKVYFSCASSKFGAQAFGGPKQASRLDVLEHSGNGRLIVYDPADQSSEELLDGLNIATGEALPADESFALVNQPGHYREVRYWLRGPRAGESEVILELPSFPDNIERGAGGRFWVALVSPRSKELDALSGSPFLRKVVQRLPAALQPDVVAYVHILAIDEDCQVLEDLQYPSGAFEANTSVLESADSLWLVSLT